MNKAEKLDKWEKTSLRRHLVLPEFDLSLGVCSQTDPEIFFPEKGEVGNNTRAAIALCKTCPVMTDCLSWALTNDEKYGIWGGTTPLDRDRLKGKGRGSAGGVRGRPRKAIVVRNTRNGL